ncbi:Ca2+-transporting ATPase [Amphibacillus marinus]|uniref:P-type Ca(2+) transporter n=1 Tax=Amphibacillus marinus TaxID=872970 RepID=A0A1H8I098_9BACI|nr:cation-translocating P-type ATPase [Amphibacillus marinus]SEN61575.1 Ca2+-transporting ATPase [Amphibacillus marinus]
MNWYELTTQETLKQTNSNAQTGLSETIAQQRLKKYGENQLTEQKQSGWLIVFFKQFQDFMVMVLLVATCIAAYLGEVIDAVVILIIVLINSLLGFFQERKAEKSLAKLREMATPIAHVLRDGKWTNIPSQEVVVGDIVKVKSGDRIVADLRILSGVQLTVEESALTGESLPVEKKSDAIKADQLSLGDQHNMAFMGSLVSTGHGVGVVVATGMQTMVGQIADLIVKAPTQKTPLEKRLQHLGKVLIVISIALTALVVLAGVWRGHPPYQMFLAGISLAVAVIPEGLPAIVTVVLSLGVQRMIKRKAIVRKLSAVETLGSTTVICSDKTGTLTENKMTVVELYVDQQSIDVSGGYSVSGQFTNKNKAALPNGLAKLLSYGTLCSNARWQEGTDGHVIDGDPTEAAILMAATKFDQNLVERNGLRRIYEVPFDSNRKRMTVVMQDEHQQHIAIVKGAPDILLDRIRSIELSGRAQPFDQVQRKRIEDQIQKMANQAYRTIAVCIKPVRASVTANHEELESGLTFLGLIGIMDPPRAEAKQAIEQCKKAGIKTVMITGDHASTARAIAQQLDLMPRSGKVLTGHDLTVLSDEELINQVEETYVFARVTPKDKLRIVQALQQNGHVVAMTGDGINDAPALKVSDIGISMGVTGTDVAKEASELILLDDNFSTIVGAVEEGRNIYENIRKFIRYLLSANTGEILVMLFAMVFALPLPLLPVQILWVNLVTDGLPALALGLDKSEKDLMEQPPRPVKEGVFARGLGFKIISRGLLIGMVTFVAFLFAYQNGQQSLEYARTIAFGTLVMAQLIHVFDCRNPRSIFDRHPFGNKYLIMAVLSSVLLLCAVVYWSPLQPLFYTVSLSLKDWLGIILLSSIPTLVFSFTKR